MDVEPLRATNSTRIAIVVELRKRMSRANANLAVGHSYSLALRPDGSVACWGNDYYGQAPPDGVPGEFVAVAAGDFHSLALRPDGKIA